jgi:hypothetical protein
VELMGKAEGGNGTAACSRQRLYRSQPWWVKREGEDSPLLDDLVDLVRMQTLGARAVHRSDSEIIGLASSGKVADGVACIEPN